VIVRESKENLSMKARIALISIALLATAAATPALAMDQGDWLIRFGLSNVDPKSNNHPAVSVDSATSVTFNFTYMMTDNWAVEVLAAYPFKHDIYLVGGPEVGSTKHLPPTVSLQYHFMPASTFQPYIGLGVNYTDFFSEKLYGPLEGASLSLDSSWGFAGEIGADIMLGETWFLNGSLRYIGIESDATVNGEPFGKVKIDPWVYGVHLGFRF
jgi:outer membrane protein